METKDIVKYVDSKRGQLIGFFSVSFPVYVVHVVYDSVDTDPFFPVYRALLKYTMLDPNLEKLPYFSRLIGFDSDLLRKRCLTALKEDGMIRYTKDHYEVTEDARRKYLTANSRPTVRVTGSFLVDGKDLSKLPEVVYSERFPLCNKQDNVSVHLPIDMAISQDSADKVLELLKKSKNKELFRLESSGDNFEVLSFDRKFLKGAFAVLYTDETKTIYKDIIFEGKKIDGCKALGSARSYTIDMVQKDNEWSSFRANLGYNVSNVDDKSQVPTYTPSDGWGNLMKRKYEFRENVVIKMEEQGGTLPPCLVISEELLLKSSKRREVLHDAERGYTDFSVFPHGLLRIRVKHTIQMYIDFMKVVSEWNQARRKDGKAFAANLEASYPNWRRMMVDLELFNELERIDCDCFILNQ